MSRPVVVITEQYDEQHERVFGISMNVETFSFTAVAGLRDYLENLGFNVVFNRPELDQAEQERERTIERAFLTD